MGVYAVLSDIHGNMQALLSVANDMNRFDIDGIILLGDLIDYGMQPIEVIDFIKMNFQDRVICNIWGNHEFSIIESNFDDFSSKRGVNSAKHTASQLNDTSRQYLINELVHDGFYEFQLENKKVFAVHGSLENKYWKAISPDNVRGEYKNYDLVLSGHSHYAHFFTKFYDADDEARRNKHAVVFINPGSVGQPRNHNPRAQYALLDVGTMSVNLRAVEYDIKGAMALFDGNKDDFYRARLVNGI